MLKSLMVALYERVILAYKSTLLGIALAIGVEVANFLAAQPSQWAHAVAAVLGIVLALVKPKAPAPDPAKPVSPV